MPTRRQVLPEPLVSRIHPDAVAYRNTFLRLHIPAVLSDTREVLAVQSLIDQAPRGVQLNDKIWLLDQFFDSDTPDLRCWVPVALQAQSPLNAPERPQTLTDRLISLRGRSAAGILLKARTGAGKTLAAFKAFRDCFRPVRADDGAPLPPPLAGYLPLWLPVNAPVSVRASITDSDQVIRNKAPQLLRELMAAAGLPPARWREAGERSKQVDQWTANGPPLLLFVDLNLADDLTRRCLAEAIGPWQSAHGSNNEHRVVVTYRSALDDHVLNTLRAGMSVHECDLEPVKAGEAKHYLRNYRMLEQRFYDKRLQAPAPARELEPDAEADLLEHLVERHGNDRTSLISTPLLMHFASTLKKGLSEVHTISDLYDRVVDESLERDLRHTGDRPKRTWPRPLDNWQAGLRLIEIVMTRVALAILAKNPNDTRLSSANSGMSLDDLFASLVQTPADPIPKIPWQHPDEFWSQGPYQSKVIAVSPDLDENRPLNDAILEVGLFRRDQESLGFTHDSLVYYFACKLALRDYKGPGKPPRNADLGSSWPVKVAERIRDNPAAWE
jgi:hypothetical protein